MVAKFYHGLKYFEVLDETHQYYDDVEIWSDYPPGYEKQPQPEEDQDAPMPFACQ